MQNSRIVEILKSFSPSEIKEFRKFLRSPFFGCKAYELNFFNELIKHYPEFDKKKSDRKIIYEKLYKGKEYNDGIIRKMSSELTGFAEEYIMYCEFRKNEAFRNQTLLAGIRNRKLKDLFEIRSAKIVDRLSKEKTGSQTFFNKYLIDNEIHSYHLTIKSKHLGEYLESGLVSHIIIFIEHLLHFIRYTNSFGHEYRIKSEILNKLLNNSDLEKFKESLINSLVISESGDKKNSDDKIINYLKLIFLKYLISENNDDEASYAKFRDLLFENKDKLTGHTVLNSFAAISQFIARHNSESETGYLEDAFRINEIILKDKLFLEHAEFLQITFCGYHISTCLKLNRIDAVSDFIKSFSEYFHSEYKTDMINYCNSLISFSEGNYEKSLEFISKTNFDRPALKASAKILKIKICYELNFTDLFYSELSTLKRFYSSDTMLSDPVKLNIKNFINAISKIAKMREMKDKDELFILERKIKQENIIREKNWLMEKLSVLK